MLLLYDYRIVDNILLLLLVQGQGHRLRNKSEVYAKVFCEVFLLFISDSFSLFFFIHLFLFNFFSSLHYIDTAAHLW